MVERLNSADRFGIRLLPWFALAGYGVAGLLVAMQGLLRGVIFVLHDVFATLGLPFMFLLGMAGWNARGDALGRITIGPTSHGGILFALVFLILAGASLLVKGVLSPEQSRTPVALAIVPGILICVLGGFVMTGLMVPGLVFAFLAILKSRT